MRWQEKIIGKVRVKKYSKSSLKVSCFIRLPSSLLHLIFQFRFSLLFQLPPPFIFQFPHFNWQEKVVLFILDLPQYSYSGNYLPESTGNQKNVFNDPKLRMLLESSHTIAGLLSLQIPVFRYKHVGWYGMPSGIK